MSLTSVSWLNPRRVALHARAAGWLLPMIASESDPRLVQTADVGTRKIIVRPWAFNILFGSPVKAMSHNTEREDKSSPSCQ